jgi:general secretion pathway protein L
MALPGALSIPPAARRFFHWWWTELRFFLPSALYRWGIRGASCIWAEVDGKGIRFSRIFGDHREEVLTLPEGVTWDDNHQRQPFSDGKVLLLLPTDQVLRKRTRLPLATEHDLYRVLSFELDRLSPYSADQVYFDYRVLARNERSKQLDLELLISDRASVDPLLERLASLGITPMQVTVLDPQQETPETINLLPESRRPRPPGASQLVNPFIAGCLAALCFLWLLIPLYQQQRQYQSLQPLVAEAQQQAEQTRLLQQRLERLIDDSTFLSQKQRLMPDTLQLMNELTLILPDDTWVNQLQIKEGSLMLRGRTAATTAVVQLLEDSPLLQNVRFRSPVKPDAQGERFHLSAEISPEAQTMTAYAEKSPGTPP